MAALVASARAEPRELSMRARAGRGLSEAGDSSLPEQSFASAWNGSFDALVAGSNSTFCSTYLFGRSMPYVCAGGGSGASGGGNCEPDACSSGQYSFSAAAGWTINVPWSSAQGGVPYRAFAYTSFCGGVPIGDCWGVGPRSFGFRFRLSQFDEWPAYIKLLSWNEAGQGAARNSLLGVRSPALLPPSWVSDHPGSGAQLLVFPRESADGTLGGYKRQLDLHADAWHDVDIVFAPNFTAGPSAFTHATVYVNGSVVAQNEMSIDILSARDAC